MISKGRKLRSYLGLCLMLVFFWAPGAESASAADQQAQKLSKTQLPTIQGEALTIEPASDPEWTVLCFLGTECPLARLYGPRLQQLQEEFANQPIRFVGVNSNLQDSVEEVRQYVSEHKLTFPFGKDYDNRLANQLQVERAPEVIVLDQDLKIQYRGRVDDQFLPGTIKKEPSRRDLYLALQELVQGKAVSVPQTEPAGCLIGRAFEGEVTTQITYCQEVSRILQKHCVECHRPNEIGPFSLTDYDEVIGWGDMMLEVIDQGRMPPWHANPKHGKFTNAREMPDEDKKILKEWVHGGMPYGKVENLPEPVQYLADWKLPRQPDLVLEMSTKPFVVPEEGVIEYQYFVVDPGFKEDRWIAGAQVLPGNRSVVHHCIVYVRPEDGKDLRGSGWVGAYVPGQRSTMMPKHCARLVPAGSHLVFQMHYTPTGTQQEDLTKIGLLFADEKEVTHEVMTLIAINQNFEIPPQHPNFAVSGENTRMPQQGELLAIAPHMHYRGKSFRAFAEIDGETQILLDVPQYDFNWQHVYELAEPYPMSAISKLSFTSHFDNSKGNPFNPDPTQHVTWGDQTWEEMAIAFFEVAIPRNSNYKRQAKKKKPVVTSEVREQKAKEFADQFFKKFDEDGNGVIIKSELPLSMQRYGFRKLDRNGNHQLEREEIEALAASKEEVVSRE